MDGGASSILDHQPTVGSLTGAGDSTCGGSVVQANLEYGEPPSLRNSSSSSSDWQGDASDKESLQSWAKEAQAKEEENDVDLFAKKEGKRLRLRFLFVAIGFILVGVGLCIFTYLYLTGQERDDFESSVR